MVILTQTLDYNLQNSAKKDLKNIITNLRI